MQAISKEKHDKLCKLLQDVKSSLLLDDTSLIELESELEQVFKEYRDSFNELKTLIMEYNTKQKAILYQVKKLTHNRSRKQMSKVYNAS
jgi:hypothetical protein